MNNKLILASSSPRRQELLKQVRISYTLRKQDFDESQISTANPEDKVRQLAIHKGLGVPIHDNEIILSADTVVSYNQQIFEKPQNKEEAYQMISALSGGIHEVFTGVMLRSEKQEKVFVERTKVEFWTLSDEEIQWYLLTDEPYDKAGAYGIQNTGAMFVKQIIGDYYNVVGLPISRVIRELKHFSVFPRN
ncbi:Maf family protein [Gracilibacillus sp. YIM 98692]|uniref:Maf family protein n=1 Tax=Gracilibacillus sp. YIM 98692 TaxID=2663532 RepID=UPI0013D78901|nr:Maf family protein [Gracilibacillus sp. YIM 98692]